MWLGYIYFLFLERRNGGCDGRLGRGDPIDARVLVRLDLVPRFYRSRRERWEGRAGMVRGDTNRICAWGELGI